MIAQYFPPDFGGASTRAYNATQGLMMQGFNITVISAFPHYPHGNIPKQYKGKLLVVEKLDGIKLIRTWVPNLPHSSVTKRIILHLSFIWSSLFGLFYVKKIDIIFAMNPNLFSFFSAWVYKVIFRKNVIRNVDDLWPEAFYELGIIKSKSIKKILDFLTRITYNKSAVIIPACEGYVKTISSKYHIPLKKIVVIEQGVDTEIFHDKKSHSTHKKIKKTVMYSGALNICYDFELVVKAAKLLEQEPVQFIIRGFGEGEENLRKMVRQHGVKNVEIRTNFLPKEELVDVLNSADIFLLPLSPTGAIDKGLPTKTLEYQALGKPIVCISKGEAAKYIKKTKSGLVLESRDHVELARLIMQLVRDNELANKLGTNGKNNIKNNLTLDKIGKRFMDVINKYK